MLVKSKSKLSDKGEIARKILEKKVTALNDEAKKFVTQVNLDSLIQNAYL